MKPTTALAILLICLLQACSSSKKTTSNQKDTFSSSQAKLLNDQTFQLTSISDDDSYGYTEKNPVKVGGVKNSEGPTNERRFLNALLGPDNELVKYHRVGSCCPFDSPNGLMGGGMLDRYEVTYEGLNKPIILYINMYDYGVLLAPKGFTFKK